MLQLLVNLYPPYTSPYASYRMLAILRERGWLLEADGTRRSCFGGDIDSRVSEQAPGAPTSMIVGETRASWELTALAGLTVPKMIGIRL